MRKPIEKAITTLEESKQASMMKLSFMLGPFDVKMVQVCFLQGVEGRGAAVVHHSRRCIVGWIIARSPSLSVLPLPSLSVTPLPGLCCRCCWV